MRLRDSAQVCAQCAQGASMARAPKAPAKGGAVDLSRVPADVLAGARLVVAEGLSAVKAAEQAGCSRHAIARLLAKPGAAAALATATTASPPSRPPARGRGPRAAHRAEVADQAQVRRDRVLADRRAGVPPEQTCAELGIAPRTYRQHLADARAEGAAAFRERAGDWVGELEAMYAEIMYAAARAGLTAFQKPPEDVEAPDGRPAGPDLRGGAAALQVAIKACDSLAVLAGIRSPKENQPEAERAAALRGTLNAITAQLMAGQAPGAAN